MDLTALLIGAAVGVGVAYLLFYLLHKSNSVSKQDHETLSTKLNDSATALKLAEDRLTAQQEQTLSYRQKAETKESELSSLFSRTAMLEATLNMNGQRLKELSITLTDQTETNKSQQAEINSTKQLLAQYAANNEALLDKLNTQKEDMLSMQKTAHLQFEKLAQQIFEEKSGKFTEANKNNIEALLKPLNENIDNFKKKVEETYDKESKQRFSLEKEVQNLIENTQKISQEANNLASALKGQAKKQGDWGETILERILELSGLEKNREYFIQENLKDEHGLNQRPDIIVRLPDDRNIIIDSKVSLNAYLRYSEADSKEQQDIFIASHLQAINQHIDQLSAKKYEESEELVSLFTDRNIDYVFAGDFHGYARVRSGGTNYIITGGGGAFLNEKRVRKIEREASSDLYAWPRC